MKKIITALTLCILALSAQAYSVKVRVAGPEGNPEEYATCRIFPTPPQATAPGKSIMPPKAVCGGVTDSLGIYSTPLPNEGAYTLVVELPGTEPLSHKFEVTARQPDADLGTLTLGGETLGEVTVTAQRPLVIKEIDRIGYDVQADDDSRTSSLSEILRKVPMVSVDAEGNISVNGSSDFKIYKNGRPNSTMSKNAKDLFKALPASMIKKIEVITEPGAKYDAEGVAAILNIVTVENAAVRGVTGTASLSGNTLNPFQNASLWLTSQIDKVTFSVNGGTHHMTAHQSRQQQYVNHIYENGNTSQSNIVQSTAGWMGWGGLEASYDINARNLITAEMNMFSYGIKPAGSEYTLMTDPLGQTLSSYHATIWAPKYHYLDLDGTVSYQYSSPRQGETLALSYMISTTNQDNHLTQDFTDIVGDLFPYTAYNNLQKQKFTEHTFQGDWSRPLGKIQTLDLGAKYVLRRNHSQSDNLYEGWQNASTDFLHVTDIAALYAQYSVRWGKFMARGGLRYEYSHLKASYPKPSDPPAPDTPFSSNLGDWVPSAALSWQINMQNSLTFNYATRIQRPGISWLDPTENYRPTEVKYGNPDLKSARFQSLKLAYMLIKPKLNAQISANYSFSNNCVSETNTLEGNLVHQTYANVGRQRTLDFSGFMQLTAGSKTKIIISPQVQYYYNAVPQYRIDGWTWGGYLSLTQQLPWHLEAQAMAYVMRQWNWDAYSSADNNFNNRLMRHISLKRSFLNDRLSVSLQWQGVGQPRRHFTQRMVNGPYTGTTTMTMKNQNVGLNISYRFGSLQAHVKKTKANVKNDDLGGQKSGGGQGGGQGN